MDTVKELQPHQQRVMDEKTELDSKLDRLEVFLNGKIFETLPRDEQWRLIRQAMVMRQYSDILSMRIVGF